MEKVVVVTGVQNPAAYQCACDFSEAGYSVFAITTGGDAPRFEDVAICSASVDPLDAASISALMAYIRGATVKVDILVISNEMHCANDGSIAGGHDCASLLDTLNFNVNGCRNLIEAFISLLRLGDKRIALLGERPVSNAYCTGSEDFGYHMSRAAANMLQKIYFNALRPAGFTFRNFVMGDKPGGISAKLYIERGLCYDPEEPYIHSDENRLVMRDNFLREIPW